MGMKVMDCDETFWMKQREDGEGVESERRKGRQASCFGNYCRGVD